MNQIQTHIRLAMTIITLAIGLVLLASTLAVLASSPGGIGGRTWVYYHGTFIRWSGVEVKLQQEGQIISTTLSGDEGTYSFSDIPPGAYDLVGDIQIICRCYHGVRAGIVISDVVERKNLLLYGYAPCCRHYFPTIMKGWSNLP